MNDGGPAYPVGGSEWHEPIPGMTLLDHFAGLAMNGMLSMLWKGTRGELASSSYNIAEAMIKERERRMKDAQED